MEGDAAQVLSKDADCFALSQEVAHLSFGLDTFWRGKGIWM